MYTYFMYFPCPPLQSALSILTFFSYLQLVGGIELLLAYDLPISVLKRSNFGYRWKRCSVLSCVSYGTG